MSGSPSASWAARVYCQGLVAVAGPWGCEIHTGAVLAVTVTVNAFKVMPPRPSRTRRGTFCTPAWASAGAQGTAPGRRVEPAGRTLHLDRVGAGGQAGEGIQAVAVGQDGLLAGVEAAIGVGIQKHRPARQPGFAAVAAAVAVTIEVERAL